MGVVQAVQEWLFEEQQRRAAQAALPLRLRHTREDFTEASLAADGMSYQLVLTKTRNPSWFIFKPS